PLIVRLARGASEADVGGRWELHEPSILPRRSPRAPVPVLEADDVFDLRRRHLEDVAVLEGGHPVPAAGPDANRVAGRHPVRPQLTVLVFELELEIARQQVDALVLPLVVLERESLSAADVDDLADVARSDRPADLVTPGLLDLGVASPVDADLLRHHPWLRPSRPATSSSADRRSRTASSVGASE